MLVLVTVSHRHIMTCESGLYELEDSDCVTPDECSNYKNNYRAYKALGRCVRAVPGSGTAPEEQDDGSFECTSLHGINFYSRSSVSGEREYSVQCLMSNNAKKICML